MKKGKTPTAAKPKTKKKVKGAKPLVYGPVANPEVKKKSD